MNTIKAWSRAAVMIVAGIFSQSTYAAEPLLPTGLNLDGMQVQPTIFAGDPAGSPAITPAGLVDPNTTGSLYAGIGSVEVTAAGPTIYLGSGVVIDPTHVLTAAHIMDFTPGDGDGIADVGVGAISFALNYGSNLSHTFSVTQLDFHPDFDGFNNPSGTLNDDLAILTLDSPVPAGVPIYPLLGESPLVEEITLAGYGESGNGVAGTTDFAATRTVKRVGMNRQEEAQFDDEGSGMVEVFLFDFDDPVGTAPNIMGGETLGNDIEVTVGPGDSGGASFVEREGNLVLSGIISFQATFTGGPTAPLFDSGGGGIVLYPYNSWITSIATEAVVTPEPSTYMLLATMLGAGILKRRRLGSERSCPHS